MRKEVITFSEEMEKTLKENDHKPGWDGCSDDFLHNKLLEEVAEYLLSMREDPVEVIRDFVDVMITKGNEIDRRRELSAHAMGPGVNPQGELTDIANICMMLHDNHKGRH